MSSILKKIKKDISKNKKNIGILIDPDKYNSIEDLNVVIESLKNKLPDFIFVGGSMINNNMFEDTISTLRESLNIPIIIFPGNNQQISNNADGILLLSLISGRNAEYLIGQHVQSSFKLKNSKIDILSTGYILVDCGSRTSVQYVSNTTPIPYTKNKIAAATALAGEQLGLSLIYLEGGSGADKPISCDMINIVRKNITVPLIVGGGIRNKTDVEKAWSAGADIVIVGTAFEKDPNILL